MPRGAITRPQRLLENTCLRRHSGRWWQKALLVLVLGTPAVLVGGKAAEIVFVSACMHVGTLPALRRARAADPQDPEISERIGQAGLYDFLDSDPGAALKNLRRAVTLAPARPAYWENLGLALESVHEYPAAQAALAHARDLDPLSPQAHWVVANCDLSADDTSSALSELRKALDLDGSYSKPVYDFCLRAGIAPRTVAKLVLPVRDRARFQIDYAAYLVGRDQTGASAEIWNDAIVSGQPLEFAWAQPYIDELMRDRKFPTACRAWRDLERLGVIPNPQSTDHGELMFNGGFEREPLNAGFDWHYARLAFVQLDFDDSGAHQGRKCLRIDFTTRENREYIPLYQDVATKANQLYLLTASVKSDGITSLSGPRLRVVNLKRPATLDVASEQTLGTTAWHRIQLRFATGRDTHFVQVFVWRPQSVNFPTEISGSFWLDDVTLKPVA